MMTYKLLRTNQDGIKIYAKIDDNNLCRITCSEQDPDFIKWVAEGNTPLPAENT
jgi:hypothetical protein